jgi:uncharacterized membrane protein required for colicin V production
LTIDIVALLFLVLLTVLGWFRGLVAQIATLGAAVLLYLTRDLWADPMTAVLGAGVPTLADHPALGRLVAFVLLFLAILILAFIIERAVIRKVGPLKLSNHWLGAVLGAVKGVVYAVLAVWLVEAVVLWEQEPEELTPGWLADSFVVQQVGPWNPVRLFSLKEVVEEAAERIRERRETGQEEPAEAEAEGSRAEAIEGSPPVMTLISETAEQNGWSELSYRELATDPRVRQVLADPAVKDLLFGK